MQHFFTFRTIDNRGRASEENYTEQVICNFVGFRLLSITTSQNKFLCLDKLISRDYGNDPVTYIRE
jgi:hypothetical protein